MKINICELYEFHPVPPLISGKGLLPRLPDLEDTAQIFYWTHAPPLSCTPPRDKWMNPPGVLAPSTDPNGHVMP